MMAFTDDDLEWLKEYIKDGDGYTPPRIVKALIARLELSELCCESLDDLLHHGTKWPNGAVHEANPELAKERLEAWRAACGKAGK